ncbi:MAG: DUF58 domain-containing protein [Candidatus Ventricola sp.]
MTARGFYTLLFGAVLMLTALSVGSGGAFLLGAAALLAWLLSLSAALCACLTCRVAQRTDLSQAARGGACRLTIAVRLLSPLPLAPLSLSVRLPSGRVSEFLLPARLIGETVSDNAFPCPHVGVFPVGVTRVTFTDCFGLFTLRRAIAQQPDAVTVLPDPRDLPPLPFSPGEGETTSAQRAQADRTTPTDTRPWQEGDELKRVHWKLSMRRQALMVHTYETPQRPDALILLDCAPPPAEGAARAAMIDALTETCAGVAKALLDAHRITRMPLSGDIPRELSGQLPEALDAMRQALAQESFARRTDFARVLLLSARRMRRTGSTAILSCRLTPAIADAVIALGRMGPHTHFWLVVSGGMDKTQEKLLHLLRRSGVEATLVRA